MRARFISNERRDILIDDAGGADHHPKIVAIFWPRFLAAKPDTLTDADWWFAGTLAKHWNTCACGSLNDGIPREPGDVQPTDADLISLGCEFYGSIMRRDLKAAQKLFIQINNRAEQVITHKTK